MGSQSATSQEKAVARTDEELILAFQGGREDAFSDLVRRYKDPLMNFAFRFLGDFDDADDVVQETFIRVYRNKHAYTPVAKFSTWIYTIAGNLAKSRLKSRNRHALFSISRSRSDDDGGPYEIPDTRYAADAAAESAITSGLIQRALDKLSAKYKEIVLLCDVQELTYEEVCNITGLNMGTVKSRLNRARAKLKELLKEIEHG